MGCVGIRQLIAHKSVSAWPSFSRSFTTKPVSTLRGRVDRYNAVHVDIGTADVPSDKLFVAQLKGIVCIAFVYLRTEHILFCC